MSEKVRFPNYDKIRTFCDWKIVYHLAGSMTYLAPSFAPRKSQIIISKFTETFRSREEVSKLFDSYFCTCSYNSLMAIIKSILMSIPEYIELNMTASEYKEKIDPNYIDQKDEWYKDGADFVDLDACIQKIINGIYRENEIFED